MANGKQIEAGRAFVRLSLQSNLKKGLDAAGKRLQKFGLGVSAAGAGITAAGGAMLAPLLKATSDFTDIGDKLHKESLRTSSSAEFLSQLGFAANQSGTDLNTVTASLEKMNRRVANATTGTGPAAKAMEELGLNAKELNNLSTEERFFAITNALNGMADQGRAGQKAFEIFGNSAKKMTPLLKSGEDGIRSLMQQADDLGATVSTDDANSAANLADAWGELQTSLKGITISVGSALAPALADVVRLFIEGVVAVSKWVKENKQLFQIIAGVGAGLVVAGTALTGFGLAITLVGTALSGMATLLGVIGGALAFLVSPIGLVIAGIAGLSAWFLTSTQTGQKWVANLVAGFQWVKGVFEKTFGGIKDALQAGDLALAGEIAVTALRLVFLKGMALLSKSIGGRLGDMIGSFSTKLAGGDFAGAWEQVVLGMAALWDNFVAGFLSVFEDAAKGVVDAWQGAVNGISDFILEQSSQGGVFGTIINKTLGIDIGADQAKAELDKLKQIRALEKRLAQEQELRDKAIAEGGSTFDDVLGETVSIEEIEKNIANLNESLAKAKGTPVDVLEDSKAAARQFTAQTADGLREALDADKAAERAKQSQERFDESVAGGADEADDEVARLEKLLAELRAEAAKAAEETEAPEEPDIPEAEEANEAAQQVSSSVQTLGNVRGLQSLLGIGRRPIEEQQLDALQEIAKHTKQLENVEELAFG